MPDQYPLDPDSTDTLDFERLVEALADPRVVDDTADYSPTKGRVVKDSADGTLYLGDGTQWLDLSTVNFGVPGFRAGRTEGHGLTTVSSATTSDGSSPYWVVDTSGGALTFTIGTVDAVDGRELNIKQDGANDLTVATEGSATVNEATTYTIGSDESTITVVYDADKDDWGIW